MSLSALEYNEGLLVVINTFKFITLFCCQVLLDKKMT